jgi:uncharacterized protein (TIGR01440 family)
MELTEIGQQMREAFSEYLSSSDFRAGQIIVIGCSTSEVHGGQIGKDSQPQVAETLYEVLAPMAEEKGLYLAFQCCEHLNRALVVDREVMEKYNLTEVSVVPHIHAGGSMASFAYRHKKDAVMVESIQAHGGLDIGETLIGMHLRPVAVPKRLQVRFIGNARLNTAVCRPKLIGGERAKYCVEDTVCNM